MSFTIDGITWEYPCQIERAAEIKASELSALMLNKEYFNDVQGTWMSYGLTLAVPFGSESDYYAIYEQLTQPVEGHTFVLPYNGSTIEIFARVTSVSDVWVCMKNGNYWRGTKFEIIANHPSKTVELGEVLTRGRSPVPPLPWSGWVRFYIDDDGYLHLVKTTETELDFYIDDNGVLHSIATGDVIEYTPYGWDRVTVADGDNILF